MRNCCYRASKWKILLVDDEEDVILITKLALEDYTYYEKGLEFITAKSAKEAMALLDEYDDIAVVFLDIIMEHERAGFDVIKYLRDVKSNHQTRVVIRTGEPGEYPEINVVNEYEINDYKSKGELTEERLNCTVTTALRSYCDLLMLEHYKNSESTMVHKSKLILFGEMMNMMLHQWQQPITSINLYCALIEDLFGDYELPKEFKENIESIVEKINDQTLFLGNISKDFRQFFKVSAKEDFYILEAVEKTLFLVGDLLKQNGIFLHIDIDSQATLNGDKNEFKHVVLNLIKNSMDAYENKNDTKKDIIIKLETIQEDKILTFQDYAGGIPEELLPQKIFEPYNTSKKDGSGIGLWMCKLIVQNMHGTISAINEDGGTKMEMRF